MLSRKLPRGKSLSAGRLRIFAGLRAVRRYRENCPPGRASAPGACEYLPDCAQCGVTAKTAPREEPQRRSLANICRTARNSDSWLIFSSFPLPSFRFRRIRCPSSRRSDEFGADSTEFFFFLKIGSDFNLAGVSSDVIRGWGRGLRET